MVDRGEVMSSDFRRTFEGIGEGDGELRAKGLLRICDAP